MVEFVVAEHDTTGGSGANFIVVWSADRPVSDPVIESVMISTRAGQDLSFTSRGVPIVRSQEYLVAICGERIVGRSVWRCGRVWNPPPS